ncbi:MAG: DUF3793 family protein [Oscillospiraceae bacterium]|nr:DUF3793 family protein [Oscillospiraceae bacterium]
MSEEYLVDHAAPTLAGLKTGSLFPCSYDAYDELKAEIGAVNRALAAKGLRLIPMRRDGKRALLYLYRPARLKEDLSAEDAAELLRAAGYPDLRQERCVTELMKRLRAYGDFPHEIGLFLSYPPEDVRGFIKHRGHNSKLDGCWKVYGDVERARKLFRAYKKCTDCYNRQKAMGVPLDRLAVAG